MTDRIEEIREKFERLTRHIALVSEEMRRQSDRADKAWAEVEKLRAENERLRAAARNALNELNCIEEDGGHRCIRCDSEIDEGHHVRLALRNALEGKP